MFAKATTHTTSAASTNLLSLDFTPTPRILQYQEKMWWVLYLLNLFSGFLVIKHTIRDCKDINWDVTFNSVRGSGKPYYLGSEMSRMAHFFGQISQLWKICQYKTFAKYHVCSFIASNLYFLLIFSSSDDKIFALTKFLNE